MKLFGVPFSPFVRKVMLVATEKGVSYEISADGPGTLTPEFVAASPLKKIPAIQDGDFTLADSTAIAVYLEAKYPQPALLPADPQLRGKAVWFDEVVDTVLMPAGGPAIFNRFVMPRMMKQVGDEEAAAKSEAALQPHLAWLETQMPDAGWMVGAEFTLADIALASMFRTFEYVGITIDPAHSPKTAAWYARVSARPAWQAVAAQEAAAMG